MEEHMDAIINGKVVTVTGPVIDKGTVLYDKGKIVAVGKNVKVPKGAKVFDAKGCYVTPGLIDIHTHISTFAGRNTMPGPDMDGNEMSNPITPEVRAYDAVYPEDIAIPVTRKAGFTTVYTLPGSANLIGGTGIAIKLRGHTVDEMAIPGTEMMKFALGENPKRCYGADGRKMPYTRMGNAGLLRKTLFEAKVYSDELKAFEEGKGEKPKPNFQLDALVPVVRGEMTCRIHAHRADDIMTAIHICKEFNLKFYIEHCTEGQLIKDVLKKEKVTCNLGPLLLGPLKEEVWNQRLDTPAVFEKEGINFCLIADEGWGTQFLPSHIGTCMREGLSEKAAFKAVTINPAKALGLDDRIGSLEVGKDADIAIFNGHPFSNMTKCIRTIIDGKVFDK